MNFNVNSVGFFLEMNLDDNIKIKSSRKTYDVFYSAKNIDDLVSEVYIEGDFIFIDANVYNLSPYTFQNIKNKMLFNAVEDNKNIESVLKLIDELYDLKFNKKNKLIVIGGGITQDVGGFAAAIYKRGSNWVFIPTTILSMTDSCIGSKVSINRGSKNMLGMFVAPSKIFVSDFFLKSLSNDDIVSGIGESLKLSLIGGEFAYKYFLDQYSQKNYINIIKLSSLIKKKIIEHDEFDENERRVLNYGHTIGHAIECTTNYFIPHGIAVLIGMYIKNKLFYDDKHKEINNLILEMVNEKFFNIDFDYDIFIKHILSDKKNNGNEICFILLEGLGKTKFLFKNLQEINVNLKKIISSLFKKIK
jgi:3-dehydroquinate synthase